MSVIRSLYPSVFVSCCSLAGRSPFLRQGAHRAKSTTSASFSRLSPRRAARVEGVQRKIRESLNLP